MAEEKRKIALITGITGQDGSYLAELLLSKGYEVGGTEKSPTLSEWLVAGSLREHIAVKVFVFAFNE